MNEQRTPEEKFVELVTCKGCFGDGYYVDRNPNNPEEPVQIQCNQCYQGEIASYGEDFKKRLTEFIRTERQRYEELKAVAEKMKEALKPFERYCDMNLWTKVKDGVEEFTVTIYKTESDNAKQALTDYKELEGK